MYFRKIRKSLPVAAILAVLLLGVAYVTMHTTPVQKALILILLIGVLMTGMVMILRMRRFRRIVG